MTENKLLSIKERTFGLELEMSNMECKRVLLPSGFSWSKEEKSVYNTDGTPNGKFGGEINTPPLNICQRDRLTLKNLHDNMKNAGGKATCSVGIHVHLYAGDLSLKQLKNLFFLLYHCYPYVKRFCNIAEWEEINKWYKPIPTEKVYKRIADANNFNALQAALSNESAKHYLRMAFNIASYFVRRTVEFRCYHMTENFDEVEACVLASYRFLNYAVRHTEEDMKKISSYEEFCEKLKLRHSTPKTLTPMIFQGNPYKVEVYMAEGIKCSSRFIKCLIDQGCKRLCVVGASDFEYELALWKQMPVHTVTQDELVILTSLVANGERTIEFVGKLAWLEKYNTKEPLRQVALILYAKSVRGYLQDNENSRKKLESCKKCNEENIRRYEETAKNVKGMFTKYPATYGTLDDAMLMDGENTILFRFGRIKRYDAERNLIKKNTIYKWTEEPKAFDYDGIVERTPSNVTLYVVSCSPYLSNLHKVAHFDSYKENDAGYYVYCNKETVKAEIRSVRKQEPTFSIKEPPVGLEMTNPKELRIVKTSANKLLRLQKQYIKKVDAVSSCSFCYLFFYGDYCIGGLGCDFSKKDAYDLWQKSDFCTNNDVFRLSKFILLCIKSKELQAKISRQLGYKVESVITYAYTVNPVSMKYRGEYKKDKENSGVGKLCYIGHLGQYTNEEIIKKYNTWIEKQKDGNT